MLKQYFDHGDKNYNDFYDDDYDEKNVNADKKESYISLVIREK